jgi:hypothetical protein
MDEAVMSAAPAYVAFHAFRQHIALETLPTLPVKGKATRETPRDDVYGHSLPSLDEALIEGLEPRS